MDFKVGVEAIAHVIQLAVAPVFLLTLLITLLLGDVFSIIFGLL